MDQKKKILFIWTKKALSDKKRIHWDWKRDCSQDYDIRMWGKGITDHSSKSLHYTIDTFKPDFIYMTNKNKYRFWLPDLYRIKNVKKIFVEVDSYKRKSTADWYSQFHELYSRQPIWGFDKSVYPDRRYLRNLIKLQVKAGGGTYRQKRLNYLGKKSEQDFWQKIKYLKTWKKVPLFRWSVPENSIHTGTGKRKGVYFLGRSSAKLSRARYDMVKRFKDKIIYVSEWNGNKYNEILKSASALICPTESLYGDYVPAKFFEFAASGAAVITNCNLKQYNINDFSDKVIQYTDLDDLELKLSFDFREYHGKAADEMRNHTHRIRYKELFG